ncbi:MAG: zinc ribbon domain-containing protein [Cellulosilyticaceae bacterium]
MESIFGIKIIYDILTIIVAVLVYRDAKKHDLDPWLFVLAVIFIPKFIGVLTYLAIRNWYERKWQCSKCNHPVLEDYNICPECKALFQRTCEHCRKIVPLESSVCPYCTQDIMPLKEATIGYKRKVPVSLSKKLAIILIGFTMIMMIVTGISFGKAYYKANTLKNGWTKNMQVEEIERSNSSVHIYNEEFKNKNGSETQSVALVEGSDLGIKGKIMVKKGTVQIKVLNKESEIRYDEIFEAGRKTQDIEAITKKYATEVFKVIITFNKATGNIDLQKI